MADTTPDQTTTGDAAGTQDGATTVEPTLHSDQPRGNWVDLEADTTDAPADTAAATSGAQADTVDPAASEAGRALAKQKQSLKDNVIDLRETLKTERAQAAALHAELEQHKNFVQAWTPILQKLGGRDDLQRAVLDGTITIQQAQAEKARGDESDLREIAEDFGWYTDTGEPDLTRAARQKARVTKEAERIASERVAERVAPMEQQTMSDRASQRVETAVAYATQYGHADPDFVREAFRSIAARNPAVLLNDVTANAAYAKVVGDAVMAGRVAAAQSRQAHARTAPPRPEPDFVHTESTTSAPGPRLTADERRIAQQYRLTDKDLERAEARATNRRGYIALEDEGR